MNTKNEPGTMVRNYRFRQAAVAVVAMLVSVSLARAGEATSRKEGGPLKVFILAGDENVLEQGMIATHPNDPRGKDVPGTLMDVIAKQNRFAFLKDEGGEWTVRDDVSLHDGHPAHNNTVSMGAPLSVGDRTYGGSRPLGRIGPELMFGHVLGNALDEQILIIRLGTRTLPHSPAYSLAHAFRPPSRGGGADLHGSWDVIHFNWGVWDNGLVGEKGYDKVNGKYRVPIDQYEKNLRFLVAKMKKTGATLIWGSTTPFHEGCRNVRKGDEVRSNEVAARIMKENGVIINDLYSECLRQGFPKKPDVHSVGDLGPQTLRVIQDAIKNRKTLAKPLPRVLLIGDSISTKYARYVQGQLEGKASVYRNPGNGEHTGTGVRNIDEWLDLKTYLLSGEEYVQLVNAYRSVLENPGRFIPNYKGQKLELSGLVWFQHIQDSRGKAKAEEYETNLTALIQDVRKDLKAPNLPVVVAASWHGKAGLGTPERKVHDAQMAVGDPMKHPEFEGNVACVDTTPFWRDEEQSPGIIVGARNRQVFNPAQYNNNAETFLLIGEAVGKAMIELAGRLKDDAKKGK